MAQQDIADFPITASSTSGTQLAALLNRLSDALFTGRSGTSLPPDAVAGTVWRDTTSGTTHVIKYYNGTVSTELYSVTVATGAIVLPDLDVSGTLGVQGGSIFDGDVIVRGSNFILRDGITDDATLSADVLGFTVTLDTGKTLFMDTVGNLLIDGIAPILDGHLTRKDYVDGKFPGVSAGSFTTVEGKTVSFNSDGVITEVV